jgi:hypothetical protein
LYTEAAIDALLAGYQAWIQEVLDNRFAARPASITYSPKL